MCDMRHIATQYAACRVVGEWGIGGISPMGLMGRMRRMGVKDNGLSIFPFSFFTFRVMDLSTFLFRFSLVEQ